MSDQHGIYLRIFGELKTLIREILPDKPIKIQIGRIGLINSKGWKFKRLMGSGFIDNQIIMFKLNLD